MIFDTSKSKVYTGKMNYLKRGFLFYACASCMLLVQFVIYLVNSNYWESLDFTGGLYYLIAALGQAFLFTLIPWVILYLPFTERGYDIIHLCYIFIERAGLFERDCFSVV